MLFLVKILNYFRTVSKKFEETTFDKFVEMGAIKKKPPTGEVEWFSIVI